ncbi:hypothetical protein PMAYCL1PPCAC_00050, partial [Pristionchus mayeri]
LRMSSDQIEMIVAHAHGFHSVASTMIRCGFAIGRVRSIFEFPTHRLLCSTRRTLHTRTEDLSQIWRRPLLPERGCSSCAARPQPEMSSSSRLTTLSEEVMA